MKFINAYRFLPSHKTGLVMIIPASMRWMVPEGVAEIWMVELPVSKMDGYITNLNALIHQRLKQYDKVSIATTYIHPDLQHVDLEPYFKTKPFDLKDFYKKPFRITFFLREDRFWLPTTLDYFLLKVCYKFKLLPYLKNYFSWKQLRLINKFVKKVKRRIPSMEFVATGIKNNYTLHKYIKDLRRNINDRDPMEEWVHIYASSHIVIGVHGSNMLIPTALAAGFIEIVPDHKLIHYTEDILINHKPRYTIFLGRILSEHTSASLAATHAIQIIEHFKFLFENTEANKKERDSG
jgi:hypothetical protein